jgi:hypothetical protein
MVADGVPGGKPPEIRMNNRCPRSRKISGIFLPEAGEVHIIS